MQSGDRPSGRIFEDLSKLAGGFMGAAGGIKSDVEALVRSQAAKLIEDMDLVRREEFEVARAMAVKARTEQEVLTAKLGALEVRLAALEKKG